jgi:hypothetical protein
VDEVLLLAHEVRAVPRLCELYPGICLTAEQNARKNLSSDGRKEHNIMKICLTLHRRAPLNLIALWMTCRMEPENVFLYGTSLIIHSPHRELIRLSARNQACPAHTSRDECGLPKELTVSARRFDKL